MQVDGKGEAVLLCLQALKVLVGKRIASWKILGCIFSGKNGSFLKKRKKNVLFLFQLVLGCQAPREAVLAGSCFFLRKPHPHLTG